MRKSLGGDQRDPPMLLQPPDRFADELGVWEVTNRPWSAPGGKVVHPTVQKPGKPETTCGKPWTAGTRLTITRP
jgi:hypothetical protein